MSQKFKKFNKLFSRVLGTSPPMHPFFVEYRSTIGVYDAEVIRHGVPTVARDDLKGISARVFEHACVNEWSMRVLACVNEQP